MSYGGIFPSVRSGTSRRYPVKRLPPGNIPSASREAVPSGSGRNRLRAVGVCRETLAGTAARSCQNLRLPRLPSRSPPVLPLHFIPIIEIESGSGWGSLPSLPHSLVVPGNVLLSRAVSSQVPSACGGLTSVFGMGTGGALQPLSPEIFGVLPRAFKTAQ